MYTEKERETCSSAALRAVSSLTLPCISTSRCRALSTASYSGVGVQGSGCGVQCSGFRVWCSVFSVQGVGFRVQGLGCEVQGSACGVQGSGFRVQGSGFRFHDSRLGIYGVQHPMPPAPFAAS